MGIIAQHHQQLQELAVYQQAVQRLELHGPEGKLAPGVG